MLQAVLERLPASWDEKSYDHTAYHLIDLDSNSDEYYEIKNFFSSGTTVERIERVQNPFQYGRYLLQREYESETWGRGDETTVFMTVESEMVDKALKYNCDYRQLGDSCELFFLSVSQAISYRDTGMMIVVKQLTHKVDRDSTRYPAYVVTYNN